MRETTANTIGKEWAGYRVRFIPMDASRTQVTLTEQAFYAGATVMLGLLNDAAKSGGIAGVERLHDEIKAYIDNLKCTCGECREHMKQEEKYEHEEDDGMRMVGVPTKLFKQRGCERCRRRVSDRLLTTTPDRLDYRCPDCGERWELFLDQKKIN